MLPHSYTEIYAWEIYAVDFLYDSYLFMDISILNISINPSLSSNDNNASKESSE